MPQPRRIHVDGGIYYIHQPASSSRPIILGDQDCDRFAGIVGPILEAHHARLHAYSISSEGFHLALQVKSEPASTFMDVFKTKYSRKFNQAHETSGELFGFRYRALLIEPRAYLLQLIRYIHSQPCLRNSHSAYLGMDLPSWLVTTVATAMLAPRKERVLRAYQELMAEPPSPEEIEFFQKGSPQHPEALGSIIFFHRLRNVLPYRSALTLDDVIRSAALQRGVAVEEMLSRSRTEDVVIARALALRNATERGIATCTEVATRFGRKPSTMKESLDLRLKRHPEVFNAAVHNVARSIAPHRPQVLHQSSIGDSELEELLVIGGN